MSTDTTATIGLVIEHCCVCGIIFAFTQDFKDRRMEDGEIFHCPEGHEQHYTAPHKLKDKIKTLESARDHYKNRMYHYREESEHKEYQRRGTKAALTRTKNALARGQCPCCGDQFDDLKIHMYEKHPNYNNEDKRYE